MWERHRPICQGTFEGEEGEGWKIMHYKCVEMHNAVNLQKKGEAVRKSAQKTGLDGPSLCSR